MKNIYKLLLASLFLFIINSTNVVAQTTIKYELDIANPTIESSLPNGDYKIIVSGKYKPGKESFRVTKRISFVDIDPIETTIDPAKGEAELIFIETINFKIKGRTKVELIFEKIDNEKNVKETFKYTFNGINTKKWHTTVGVAGIALRKSDTYKTIQDGSTYKVVEDGSQKIIDPVVTMMFTFIDLEKDSSFGWSGGLGFDLENISVFAGGSYYLGHNLVITGGVALHKQLRLDNKYDVNEIVPSALNSDDLNTDYYRLNPFISLTFALDKNIFKKDN